jgi:hypothetical protein
MRSLIGLLAALVVAGFPFVASAATYPGSAPADEYFGPHKQSILEIRNRLDRFDQQSDRELIRENAVVELDDIAASISDWHAQYPNDPWLPRAYARLLRTYQRAGQSTSDSAVAVLDEMQDAYPDAPETSDIAMLYGVGDPSDTQVAAVPEPVAPPPVIVPVAAAPAAIVAPVAVAPAMPSYALGVWTRFGTMRNGVTTVAPAAVVPAAYAYPAAPVQPQRTTNVTVNVTVNPNGP